MNLIDFIMDLFRSPASAAQFVSDPEGTMRDAGVQNVSAAQFQAVAATAAPAGLALGGGDPVQGLQRAVADHHQIAQNFASPLSPQTTFAPQTHTAIASGNETEFASGNSAFSPEQASGANSQAGAFNLGFGDITLGDKSTNTATHGGVVVDGDSNSDIVSGDGAVLGNNNDVNNGDVFAGAGSNVNLGDGDIKDRGTTNTGSGDVVQGNEGPVIKDVDMSGGHGGSASAGGGLLGGGEANAGGGGAGGTLILADSHDTDVKGNQSNVDIDGDNSGKIDAHVTDINDSGNTDNSMHDSGNVVTTTNNDNDETNIASNNDASAHLGGGGGGGFNPIGAAGDVAEGAVDVVGGIFD